MLNSAADYKCVDVAGLESFITGGIMPVRDLRNDGSWRALKYEDLLFLLEGKREREYWRGLPVNSKTTPWGRSLYKSAFKNAVCQTLPSTSYINKSSVLPEWVWMSVYEYPDSMHSTSWQERAVKAAIQNVDFELEDVFYDLGRNIKGNHVRKAHWNLSRLKRTLHDVKWNLTGNGVFSSWYAYHKDPNEHPGSSETFPVARLLPSYVYSYDNVTRVDPHVNSVDYTFSASSIRYPWVTSAWLMVIAEIEAWDRRTVGSESRLYNQRHFVDVRAFPCEVENHRIHIPELNTLDIASERLGAHGIAYRTVPVESSTDCALVYLYFDCLVCDHTFPAEIDSLGWSWEPEEETE